MEKGILAMAIVLAAAGLGATAATAEPIGTRLPIPVWNQAYQENYEPDAIEDIVSMARGGYVLIDPFQPEHGDNLVETIATIRANGNAVSAYISIGTGEDWRDDFASLAPHLVDRQWDDWGGEYFISKPNASVIATMKARIDKIAAWGFDWVEFDNMDWIYDDAYRSEYGFEATIADGVGYYRTLCEYVHAKGMKCMAKSTVEGADMFDGATYESYEDGRNWWDQDGARRFLDADEPVIVIHYDATDCDAIYAWYRDIYGTKLSFLCEERMRQGYRHFNTP